MFHHRSRDAWLAIVWATVFSLLVAPAAFAQDEEPVLIQVGENKIGEISAEVPVQVFVIAITEPQVIDVQALSLDPGFAPALQVFDSSGLLLQATPNADLGTVAQIRSLALSAGAYHIEVRSASGEPGQFVLGVQEGEALAPPVVLALGEIVEGAAGSDQPPQRYTFAGSETNGMLLFVESDLLTGAPVVTLKNADSLELLALSGASLAGVRYRIPPSPNNFLVEVANSGSSADQAYTLCVQTDDATGPTCEAGAPVEATPTPTITPFVAAPTPIPPQPLPPLPTTGACVVASLTGGAVNVRSGPSTQFPPLFQISGNALAAVTGRLADGSWFQVNVNGVVGWISSSVIRIGGQCGNVTVVVMTPTPPPGSTTPTWTPDATTSITPTWTATPTDAVTPTWTPTPTLPQFEMVATLNFSLPPVYGSTALTSGFVPDPFSAGVTAGGPANVSYLGGGCSGYATAAPSFSVNYTSGAFPTLRFYFIGGGDTTMIINTPGGSYVCVDDSFGTLNPTIDFNTPSSGRYDIWIGSFAAGASVGGTLYVTENTANHP
jgi:uncharacterized protein YraI